MAESQLEAESVGPTNFESPRNDFVPETESGPLINQCESCSEETETDNLFKCSTCISTTDLSGAPLYYCDMCIILLHVKKGHEILDYNSLKPEICSEHKMISSLFCTSCTEIHCTKCVSKHTNHNIMSLKEKASEVRSKIFEKLSELENNESCIRETKERLIENRDSYRVGYEILVQNVSSELDKVKQAVLNRIKIEHDKVMGAGKESDDNLELLFKSEKDLRGLLSQSNGLMVTKFPEVELQVGAVHEVQQNLVSLEVKDIEHKFEADGFEATAQDFLKQCFERIQMPLLKNISEPEVLSEDSDNQLLDRNVTRLNLSDDHFVYLRDHESIYSICAVKKEVFVYEHEFVEIGNNGVIQAKPPSQGQFGAAYGSASSSMWLNPPRQAQRSTTRASLSNSGYVLMQRRALGKYTCTEKIKQLIVYPHLSSDTIYILTDQFDLVFDVQTKSFSYFNLDDNSYRDSLLVISDSSKNQYKWNRETRTITSTNATIYGSLQCASKPVVKMSYCDAVYSWEQTTVILTADNDVVLLVNKAEPIDMNRQRETLAITLSSVLSREYGKIHSETVRESVHKVKQIDAVSIVSERVLIWSLLTKNITVLHTKIAQCVQVVVPFECEFSYFSLPRLRGDNNDIQCLVKAKIQTSQNKFEDKEVFMVRKVENETL